MKNISILIALFLVITLFITITIYIMADCCHLWKAKAELDKEEREIRESMSHRYRETNILTSNKEG